MVNYNDYSLRCFGRSMYGGYYIEIWDMSKLPKVELISKHFKKYNDMKDFVSLYQLKLDKAYRVDY